MGAAVLESGLRACIDGMRKALADGRDADYFSKGASSLASKLAEMRGSAAPSAALGVETPEGDHLYSCNKASVLQAAQRPLRILFLDVDGVLNTSSGANCGELSAQLVAHAKRVLKE